MVRILVATASIHTTAAACDYLSAHADPDRILVVGVEESGHSHQAVADATNVAKARLGSPDDPPVETLRRSGDPATEILAVAEERDVDLLVAGAHGGDPESGGTPPGSTVTRLLTEGEWPVVVVDPAIP